MSNAIPEDLRDKHERLMRLSKGSKSQARWASIWLPLIERIAAVEAERDALKAEFDDCVKHLIFLQPAQSADEWGEPIWRLVKPRMGALRAELATARQTAEYWKAEHLAGNKIIERLSAPVSDAEWDNIFDASRESIDAIIAARLTDKEKA
jgi:hypothetical protein